MLPDNLENDKSRGVLEELDSIMESKYIDSLLHKSKLDKAKLDKAKLVKNQTEEEKASIYIKIFIVLYLYNLRIEHLKKIYSSNNKNVDLSKQSINDIKNYLPKDINIELLPTEESLRENLGFNIKIILNEFELKLNNKGYQIKYQEENMPILCPLPQNTRNKTYIKIAGIIFLLIVLFFFALLFFSTSADSKVWSYFSLFTQFFLSVSLSGFLGYISFSKCSKKNSINEKSKILQYIKKSMEEAQASDEGIKSSNTIKTVYNPNEAYLDLSSAIKNLTNQLNNQDEVSKLLHRKSKRLKASGDKIYFIQHNEVIKTSKLNYISDFLYELIDYSKKLYKQNQSSNEKDINFLINSRQTIREIEAKITRNRACKLVLFCFLPSLIFFVTNVALYCLFKCFDSQDILSKPLHVGTTYLTLGFLLLAVLVVHVLPIGYASYALFKYISIVKCKWRNNISRIEETIAEFFELFFFFLGAFFILALCFALLHQTDTAWLHITENEYMFFDTTLSAFFPIEFFDDYKGDSLLLNNEHNKLVKFIIRSLVITLSTIFSLKIVNLMVNKYRKYSYDEHSYNAFLPPELLKIFGYFSVFLVSSALAYSLMVAEFKDNTSLYQNSKISITTNKNANSKVSPELSQLVSSTISYSLMITKFSYNMPLHIESFRLVSSTFSYSVLISSTSAYPALMMNDQKEDNNSLEADYKLKPPSAPDKSSFTLTDFLPYSIFITLIGAGFAIATRDLLENYFSGVAQRVDAPFEEGDMVTIDDSSIMQVGTIGFKNVSFYDINKNAIRHIPFKYLDKQKIINFTDPTLHYRRSIQLFVSVKNKLPKNQTSLSKYPITKRAEMLLLLAAFYVEGVRVPKNHRLKLQEIKKHIEKEQLLEKIENVSTAEGFYSTVNDFLENKLTEKSKLVSPDLDSNIFLDKISELQVKSFSGELQTQLKGNIPELEKMLNKIKILDEIFSEVNIEELIQDKYTCCRVKSTYESMLIEVAKMSMEISYIYYQLALLLWELKEEENISKHEKRNIDEVSLELLNAPRVSSRNIVDDSGTPRWEMRLEVTLQLAEQSDEIIHHINSFVDKHYQVFIGSHDD